MDPAGLDRGDLEPPRIEHRHLRGALEFAVRFADEARRNAAPVTVPAPVRALVGKPRVPTAALGKLRRAIEADPGFREQLARVVTPELVDPVGYVWLTRTEGWETRLAALVADVERAEHDRELETELQRERKRREAAEQRATRERAKVVGLEMQVEQLGTELDERRAEVDGLADQCRTMRAELIDARNEVRHANDRAAAAAARAESLETDRDDASARAARAEGTRDEVLAARVESSLESGRIAEAAVIARDLAAQLSALAEQAGVPDRRAAGTVGAPVRRPLSLPGGVVGDSEAAAEHLLRSGASVLVDGYNVSMLGWPDIDLADQRRALLDAVENLARRVGADLTVVFDGARVVGAAAEGRRVVRVVYSSDGATADDVIRDEVARLPAGRAVVVVTNDAEIVRDVRAAGANTLTSEQFLAVARR